MKDAKKRSIAKAGTWRVLATLTTMALVYAFTGEITISIGVALTEVIVKTLIYYGHERIWDGIDWGHVDVKE